MGPSRDMDMDMDMDVDMDMDMEFLWVKTDFSPSSREEDGVCCV